jgi:hypothetical protein
VVDKLPPLITSCPKDTTIICTVFDKNNVGIYGSVSATDNCPPIDSVWESAVSTIGNCLTGDYIRTFHVQDQSGNVSTCQQTIHVILGDTIQNSDVSWPPNYTTHDCLAPQHLHPDSLPAPYNKPVINYPGCGLIATGFTDEVFTVSQPACYKIRRVWTICDLCVFNPAFPNGPGKLMYVQYVMVTDTLPPTLSCPAEVIIPADADCGVTKANIVPVTATDCDPNVKITNNSKFADSKGANPSGTYPYGTTVVTFVAKDACQNSSSCTMKVIVTDKSAPKPVCLYGLSTDVGLMQDSSVFVKINAKYFNENTTDNCSASNKITFSFSQNPADSIRIFDCDSLGKRIVRMYVTDEAGNQAYCETYILIQDNYDRCPGGNFTGGGTTEVSGVVTTSENTPVAQVLMSIPEMPGKTCMTADDGSYHFSGLPANMACTFLPEKDINPLNGVNTYDLVLLQKHLLGVVADQKMYPAYDTGLSQCAQLEVSAQSMGYSTGGYFFCGQSSGANRS